MPIELIAFVLCGVILMVAFGFIALIMADRQLDHLLRKIDREV